MNAPDPPHWTLNRRFGAFRTIWVHSGPFGCLTKLNAKWAELVQKFVPRSRIRILRNEHTLSNPLDPKLTFWCFCTMWVHSGPFGCRTKLGVKQSELVQKFVPRSRVGFFCNERTRSTPLDPKLTFWCVSYYLGEFEAIWLPYETRYKMGRTSAKVRARSRVGISRKEHTRSTPLNPKLMFCFVSFHLVAFRAVWLPYETRCKTG